MHAQLTEVDLPLRLGLGGPTVYMVHSTPPMRRALACHMAPIGSVACCSSLERMLFGMIMHSAVRWYGVRLVGSVCIAPCYLLPVNKLSQEVSWVRWVGYMTDAHASLLDSLHQYLVPA